ncbi:Bromodomain and WD repeat-containing protein 3, partial [Ophiophagus hannah]
MTLSLITLFVSADSDNAKDEPKNQTDKQHVHNGRNGSKQGIDHHLQCRGKEGREGERRREGGRRKGREEESGKGGRRGKEGRGEGGEGKR